MMNLVVLGGRLTGDPQSKDITTAKGPVKVVSFGLAVRRIGKEEALFANVSVFGKPGEFVIQYLKKGSSCTVEGNITDVRAYTDKAGAPRASLDVRANNVDAPNTAGTPAGAQATDTAGNPVASSVVADADIPF